jgi:hypothetical protein
MTLNAALLSDNRQRLYDSRLSFLQADCRMGGIVKYVFAPEGELMRLPPTVMKCVAFVGRVVDGEFAAKGTGFFINYPCGPNGRWQFPYFVTARHVIERCRELSQDATPYLRLNFVDGTSDKAGISNESWAFSEDYRDDIAIAGLLLPDGLDHTFIRSESVATQEVIEKNQIGAGNELFFPGLFVRHQGDKRMVPILRRGSIAAMPVERIDTKFGQIEAYLIEARSIGGLSGSPVFVNLGPRDVGASSEMWARHGQMEPPEIAQIRFGPTFLLGMMHGHYGVRDIQDSLEDDGIKDNETRSVNMGIGIVVPGYKIIDMIKNNVNLIGMREHAVRMKIEFENSQKPELD